MLDERYQFDDAKFPELDLSENYTLDGQFDKIIEEICELKEAIQSKDIKKVWKEYMDLIQAVLGLFQKLPMDKENPQIFLSKIFKEHYDKLEKRAESTDPEDLKRKRDMRLVGLFRLTRH